MESVRSLLIPLANYYLLLPNAAVAEILEYGEPELSPPLLEVPHQPKGKLGEIHRHGETIDLFSWEVYTGKPLPVPSVTQCVVVIRLPDPTSSPRMLALLSQRIPRLLVVVPESLQSVPAETVRAATGGMPVRVNGEAATIPDLTQLQREWSRPS